jgi:hypothetical protein
LNLDVAAENRGLAGRTALAHAVRAPTRITEPLTAHPPSEIQQLALKVKREYSAAVHQRN